MPTFRGTSNVNRWFRGTSEIRHIYRGTNAVLLSFDNTVLSADFGTLSSQNVAGNTKTASSGGTVHVTISTASGSGTVQRQIGTGAWTNTSNNTTFTITNGQTLAFRVSTATAFTGGITLRRGSSTGPIIGGATINIVAVLSFNNSDFGILLNVFDLSSARTAINSGTVHVTISTTNGGGTLQRRIDSGNWTNTGNNVTFTINNGQTLQFRVSSLGGESRWNAEVFLRRNNASGDVIGELGIGILIDDTTTT